ncbi:MAG TPA: 2-amino-4-hydroxy-6-hydroxymethyldihydropteridine diphosphokinase [Bryobacteraceae bacterium]|nr:2-amino-4-hydroxy-6-hydroxymethyldihydropteridine diphosphokinase [Bryobacteraceae bacterium]
MKTVYIGLGSNLGDRAANLQDARRRLEAAGLTIVRASSIYETAPRDRPNQPWFLNQVVEIATECLPRQLMARLLRIEREMGRRRLVPKGPRVIDLDILLYAGAIVHAQGLAIPHPGLGERRFVLEPLAELAADVRHPCTLKTVREMLAAVADQPVRRWEADARV